MFFAVGPLMANLVMHDGNSGYVITEVTGNGGRSEDPNSISSSMWFALVAFPPELAFIKDLIQETNKYTSEEFVLHLQGFIEGRLSSTNLKEAVSNLYKLSKLEINNSRESLGKIALLGAYIGNSLRKVFGTILPDETKLISGGNVQVSSVDWSGINLAKQGLLNKDPSDFAIANEIKLRHSKRVKDQRLATAILSIVIGYTNL